MYPLTRKQMSTKGKGPVAPRAKYNHPTTFSRAPQSTLDREVDVHVALEKDMYKSLHLNRHSNGFQAIADARIRSRILETMTRFETFSIDQRFAINARAWIRLYLGAESISPKSTFVSDLEREIGDDCIDQWFKDYKRKRNQSRKPVDQDIFPTSDPSQKDLLYILFDIVSLIDSGRVTMNEVHQQYDFVRSTLKIDDPNPLLLVLSILHNKMQCRSSADAPFGDEFVDRRGKPLTPDTLSEAPSYSGERNPQYHLITKKCPHGRDCRYLHNAQRICMEYALNGCCRYEDRHTDMVPDTDGYSMFWVKEDYPNAICPYAHLCLVCHLIQRQAHDFIPNTRAGPSAAPDRVETHRVPCHLRSATEQAFADAVEEKLKRMEQIFEIVRAYQHHFNYCVSTERCSYLDDNYYQIQQKQCKWCHEGGFGEKYSEFPAHMRQVVSSIAKLPKEKEMETFFNLFGGEIENPDFYTMNDLLVRPADYLHPWEYNPNNKLSVFIDDRDHEIVKASSNAPWRSMVHRNTALFPGMCIPKKKYIKPVSTYKELKCGVTIHFQKFMRRICERPFSGGYSFTDKKFFSLSGREAKNRGYSVEKYDLDSEHPFHIRFYKHPIDAFLQLVSVVIALPEYQEYVARFSKSSPLPRHATERWGNIEPAAGVWTEEDRLRFRQKQEKKKQKQEELERVQAELHKRIEEEVRKQAEEARKQAEEARKQAEEARKQAEEEFRKRIEQQTSRVTTQSMIFRPKPKNVIPTSVDFPPLGGKSTRRRR